MLSREDLEDFADVPPALVLPRFRLAPEQSSALTAALRAIDYICRESENHDTAQEPGATLTEQLAAAEARRASVAPAVNEAVVAQEALAAARLKLSVRGAEDQRSLAVSRRRSMVTRALFEREPAE